MKRLWLLPLLAVGLALGLPCPAPACSICDINTANTLTLRQQGAQAKLILYGKLDNPQVNAALPTGGTTDLVI
jgi:hypothetical protein